MRKLYVTTRAMREIVVLIGILTEDNGNFCFEYKLGDDIEKFEGYSYVIDGLPDITVVYEGKDVEDFVVNKIIPPESADMENYDLWKRLTIFGKRGDAKGRFFLHEKLPKGARLYEKIGEVETFICDGECPVHEFNKSEREGWDYCPYILAPPRVGIAIRRTRERSRAIREAAETQNFKDRKLYVTTKLRDGKAEIIGILYENFGNYRFEYKRGRDSGNYFTEIKGGAENTDKRKLYFSQFLIDGFPDYRKSYEGTVVEAFIGGIIPLKSSSYFNAAMESVNTAAEDYDIWELLKIFGKRSVSKDVYLHEALPEGTVLIEDIGEYETFSCDGNCPVHDKSVGESRGSCMFAKFYRKENKAPAPEKPSDSRATEWKFYAPHN